MNKQTKKRGLDGGNNTIICTMIGHTGEKAIIIPTTYAPWKEYKKVLGNKKKDLVDSLDVEVILNYNNKEKAKNLGRYLVGNKAREVEGEKAKIREIGKTKTGDDGLMVCMLTTLACGAIKSQNKYEGKVTDEFDMVTGLPYLQYKENKEKFKQQFIGKHLVKFKGDYEIDVELKITDTTIECEGAGALNSLLFNKNGGLKYKEEDLIDRCLMVVEVGEFTTEVITLTFRHESGELLVEYKDKLCTGIEYGIADAKQPIIDKLREQHNTTVDRYTIDHVVKREFRKGQIDLENGETLNIIEDYENNLKELAGTIATAINNKVKDANAKGKIIKILLAGGGQNVLDNKFGNYLSEDLNNMLAGIKEKDSFTEIAENALTANADGYLEKALVIYDEE